MNHRDITRHAAPLAALIVLAACATTATAQAVDAGVMIYPAESFAEARPVTARDMLERVPGFVLVEADEDVRGYAGAQGNLLIDGVRPASKRESASDLLKRIPAASVDRIELIRGGAGGVDMGGYAVVANVVRRSDASQEGALEAAVVVAEGWTGAGLNGEYARRWGDQSLDLAFSIEPELDDDTGPGVVQVFDPSGSLDETANLDGRTVKTDSAASVVWRRPLSAGVMDLAGAYRGERTRADTVLTSLGGPAETIDEAEDIRAWEGSLRFERPFGADAKAEALLSRNQSRTDSLETARDGSDDERFEEQIDAAETIARFQVIRDLGQALSFTGAVEGALNELEGRSALAENGAPVILPGSDVSIEERRGELSAALTWTPSEDLVVEAGLRVEASEIAQAGDTPLERTFTYAKPRLAADWAPTDADRFRAALSREVGQLDFGDFTAAASLDTGQVTAGNAGLEPDKTWRLKLEWERRLWADAAFTVSWTHDEIEDVVDRVLIIDGADVFDAPGNIGPGRRDALAFDVSTPLDRFGVPGGRFEAALLWRSSRVTDPTTGAARPISEEAPFEGEASFTQDLPTLDMRWGVDVEFGERSVEYQFDKITREREQTSWSVFMERDLGDRWRARIEVTDPFGRDFRETREEYDGPRSAAPLDEIERRERRAPGYVTLTLRRSMGG